MVNEPADLVRKDPRFYSLDLNEDDFKTVDTVASLLATYPELMQRPLLDDGAEVVIARPASVAETWLAER